MHVMSYAKPSLMFVVQGLRRPGCGAEVRKCGCKAGMRRCGYDAGLRRCGYDAGVRSQGIRRPGLLGMRLERNC